MRIINLLYIFLLLILTLSCSPEDKLIDNTTNKFSFVLITNDINNPIKILNFPENNVVENESTEKLNKVLSGKIISKTKRYLDKTYFIVENEANIYVFNSNTFEYITTYSFDPSRTPIDIAFSNIADAYVIYKNKSALTVIQNNIGLIDIVSNKFVKDINIEYPSEISSILANGNSLYLGFFDKTLGKFDIRDNQLISSSKIRNLCNLSTVTTNGDLLFFIDGDSTKNLKSTIIFINPNDFANQKEFEIDLFGINSNTLLFNSLVNSPKEYTFFATNQGLLNVDTRSRNYISFINSEIYNLCRYNERNSSLILIRDVANSSIIEFGDNETGEIKNSFTLNYKIINLLPL